VSLPREQAETVEAVLEAQGALAITLQDSADEPVLEPAPGTAPLWPVVQVRGLFPARVSRADISSALLELDAVSRPEALEWRSLADRDWARAWMDRFQPMKFGRRLWIVPSGMEAPTDPRAVVLQLDPGLAFGTGTHPTTALCLRWLDACDCRGLVVVDYGCGSGVLGIAAALSGARRVVCVDNDPQALEATAANAARNGIADRIVCQDPAGFSERGADLVLANILAGPLKSLAPVLLDSLRTGGEIVLSGILEEQAGRVAEAYRPVCGTLDHETLDGWVRLHGIAGLSRGEMA